VLPPFINVGRFKGRVTESMSSALGRPVTVDSVELRLFPQPGFYLENVVVGDDPAYSAEPLLHAEEVTAYLRLSSLWRARLEIARLSLKYPSLNLVEREDASWNLESLLWKASRTQAAPTASRLSQSRARFPYIEATNGRINFKYGLEKSVFSFTEADFSLWSPAENQWRMRLEAHPVRTDMPVTDTGTVKVDTTIQRANLLRDAAMKGAMTWERVQLGNLTRLIYGEDRGWRGALETSVQFSGTPGALQFATAAKLRDFRRYDISTGNAANLNATCSGELNMGSYQLQNTECRVPLEGGLLSVQGNMQGLRSPHYDLAILAETLPADALLNLARRAKRDLPEDLTAKGSISASFHAKRMSEQPSTWIGNLVVSGLVVHSSVLGKDLVVGKAIAMANTAEPIQPAKHRGHQARVEAPLRALVVQNFDLPLGAVTPASVNGTLDDVRFAFHIKGDATLERLQQFARATGVGAPKIALAGPASIDLTIGGNWSEFSAPEVTGTAQLKNTRAEVPGLSVPVEISSARLDLDHNRLTLRNASALVSKIALSGSASFPRVCDGESPCDSTFDLTTDDLNPERWNEVLNPHLKKRPWYRLFGSGAENNVIANLHSTGHFAAHRMTLGTTVASAFETNFTVGNHILELRNAHADLLGGSFASDWMIDFNGDEPRYESTGTAARIQVEKLGTVVKASLGSGTLGLKYKMAMAGWDSTALAQSAKAETEFDWSGGALRISPDGKSPLRVRVGSGKAALGRDGWTISGSEWNTPNGLYRLTGTASRDLALAMEFTQENGAIWKVSGTLLKPQLSTPPAPQPTQARRR